MAVDLLMFTIKDDRLKIALVERSEFPFKGMLSLPGVFVGINETLDEAARRGAEEKTGLRDIYFEQLYTWGDVNRDPRMRIISVSYLSLTSADKLNVRAGERTISAALYDVDELLNSDESIAEVLSILHSRHVAAHLTLALSEGRTAKLELIE